MRKITAATVLVLGAAGLAATTAPAAASASAAKAKCWTGSWKVTGATADIKSPELSFKVKGGAGVRLKLAATGRATYDFTKAKAFTGSGTFTGLPTTAKLTLAKKLYLSSTITGSAKGKITAKAKTASGSATLTIAAVVFGQKVTKTYNLAKAIKGNTDQGVVPRSAAYACKGKNLTITQKIKSPQLTSSTTWKLQRV